MEPMTPAIMIACLASFRVLFTRQEATARPQAITYPTKQSGTSSRRGLLRTLDFRNWRSTRSRLQDENSEAYDLASQPEQQTRYGERPQIGERPQTGDSSAKFIPSQAIHVRNDFHVTLPPRDVETGSRQQQWVG